MSTWLSNPAVLAAIFSAIAAAVSALTLWFTSLKGPDIELVNTLSPKIQVEDTPLDRFVEYVPRWFALEPIELVFVNNGSKAGMITALRVDFRPSREFEPFFEELSSEVEIELPKPKQADYPTQGVPVSIREGDNSVMSVKCTVYTIRWKDPRFQDIPEGSNIRALIQGTLEANRQKLASFLNFLHSGKPLGNLTLYITYSYRSWIKIRLKMKQLVAPMEVVNSFKDAIKGYESCLKYWDNRRYRLENLLRRVAQTPNIFDGRLKVILVQLDKPIEKGKINVLPNLGDAWKQLSNQPEIQKFALEREKDLMSKLQSLAEKINDFNEEATAAMVSGGDVEVTQIERLKNIKAELRQHITEMLSEFERLRRKLVKEIFPSQ